MKLKRVTITGADDSAEPDELASLSEKNPWLEWGILLGRNEGIPRFPSAEWCMELAERARTCGMNLAAHLCGRWVRSLVLDADFTFPAQRPHLFDVCERIQLNFHGQYHKAALGFVRRLKESRGKKYIFQVDGVNDSLISRYTQDPNLSISPLFDLSGGAGMLPDQWPQQNGPYVGYAGGLSPENLEQQLPRIAEAAGHTPFWIDVETRVRSDDDRVFDMNKVREFVGIAGEFIR